MSEYVTPLVPAKNRTGATVAHPDPLRLNATVYERAAWLHDIGQHAGSEHPYGFCPRCEMEHPLGRFAQLVQAAESVLRAAGPDRTDLALGQLRKALYGEGQDKERGE